MHKCVRCSYFGSISSFVSITDFTRGAMAEDGCLFTKKGLAEDGGLFTKKGPHAEPGLFGPLAIFGHSMWRLGVDLERIAAEEIACPLSDIKDRKKKSILDTKNRKKKRSEAKDRKKKSMELTPSIKAEAVELLPFVCILLGEGFRGDAARRVYTFLTSKTSELKVRLTMQINKARRTIVKLGRPELYDTDYNLKYLLAIQEKDISEGDWRERCVQEHRDYIDARPWSPEYYGEDIPSDYSGEHSQSD